MSSWISLIAALEFGFIDIALSVIRGRNPYPIQDDDSVRRDVDSFEVKPYQAFEKVRLQILNLCEAPLPE